MQPPKGLGDRDAGSRITASRSAASDLKTLNVTIVDYQVTSKRFVGNWLPKRQKIKIKQRIRKRRKDLRDQVDRGPDPNQDQGAIIDL